MKIVDLDIDRIIPYNKNPRKNKLAVPVVAESIKQFGFRQPIVVDDANIIIAGHTRYLAAKSLGLKTCPVHIADGLSPAQAKAYRLMDNKSGESAEWDLDLLTAELNDLLSFGFDLDFTGFDGEEIKKTTTSGELGKPDGDIPSEWADTAWRMWIIEILEQIKILSETTKHPIMGFTKGRSLWSFLKAKYRGERYGRSNSFAFHPHQLYVAGDAHSVIDGFRAITNGKHSPKGVRFVLREEMAITSLLTTLPFNGARAPSDFPADLALNLINEFAPGGAVLDPCHGWGGRLVGFLLSTAKTYVGIDVSPETSEGVKSIKNLFLPLSPEKKVDLFLSDFEIWENKSGKFDMALTSPPYYDVEKYTGGEQARLKYVNYASWRDGFYAKLISKTYDELKDCGIFALQVGSQSYPLAEDGKRLARETGFEIVEARTTQMTNNFQDTAPEKGEIILILKKTKTG